MQQVHKYQGVQGVPSHDDRSVSVPATDLENMTFKPKNLMRRATTTQSPMHSSGSNTAGSSVVGRNPQYKQLTTVEIKQK